MAGPVRKVGASAKQAGNRGLGRKKGVPNKASAALKDMILGALNEKGGVDYLVTQADKNPAAFLTLLGKVLPMQVTGADGGAVVHRIELIGVAAQ